MILLDGKLEILKKSGFYTKECWDYPYEEVEILKDDENYSEEIYVIVENGRVYETTCDIQHLDELLEKLNNPKLLNEEREEISYEI